MINLTKILFTTLLSAGILGAIVQYQPLKAQETIASPSAKASTYLSQRSNNLVQAVDTIGITVSDMEQAIAFTLTLFPSLKFQTLKSTAKNTKSC